MSFIELDHVFVTYDSKGADDTLALKDIQLKIEEQELLVVLGASGCGKTTLLNLIAGFIFPSQGDIKVNGKVVDRPGWERGVVFQKNALMPWLNVQDNVEFGLKLRHIEKSERRQISEKALGWVGLADFADHYVYQLSGGMQQRVGMARALANDPAILLMDEPLGALDAITREEVQKVILDVWQTTKKTIMMITHSIEEAMFMATRLIIMTPRPGVIFKEYNLDFSEQFFKGKEAKDIKRSEKFLSLREEIIDIVEEKAN